MSRSRVCSLRAAALVATAPCAVAAQPVDEAVIHAPPRRELSRVTLDADDLRRAAGSFGDPLRAVQNLPGLARPPLLSGSLIVRGATPADTAVLVDGTFLPAAYHFGGLGSTLSPEIIDHLDFFPGNFSARYGRATGGVVDVSLRDPSAETARAVLHLSVLDAGAYVEGPVSPRVSASVAARYGWVGLLISPVVSAVTPFNLSVGYWDYQGVVTWRPTARDRVRISVYGCGDGGALRSGTASFGVGLGFHLAQVRWTHTFSADTNLTVAVSAGWNGLTVASRADAQSTLPFATPGLRVAGALDAWPVHVRAELSRRVSPGLSWRIGFDGLFGARILAASVQGDAWPQPVVRDDALAQVQPAAYAELDLAITPRIHLRPGARLDASTYTNTVLVSPRVTLDGRLWPGGLLKLGIGVFTQPALDERVAIGPEQLLYLAELTVGRTYTGLVETPRPERALHVGVGVEQQVTEALSVRVEGFYKSIQDALVGYPSLDRALGNTGPNQPQPVRYDGLGRAYGAELLARYRDARFRGWVAYTLMRAERLDPHSDDGWRLYEFDQTHIVTALASVTLGRGWELGARFRFVTGRPYYRTVEVLDDTTGGTLYPDSRAVQRSPDVHQLDVRVEKTWTRPWGSVSVHLEVVNVYNRINADAVQVDRDHTVTVPAGPFLPILPNVGVRGVF